MRKGFTLVEIIVGSAVFLVIAAAAYGAFTGLFKLAAANQSKILAVELAHERFEIIRNMPYVKVGIKDGIPNGTLSQTETVVRGGISFAVDLTIRNINLSTSTVQASSKLVEVKVGCELCQNFKPVILTGEVAPANLQTANTGGALVIRVFDSNGVPIPNVSVHVTNVATSTTISVNDVTNEEGLLNIIGVPPQANAYRIEVTKSGYSADRTYPIGGSGNPDPVKPDVTVVNQEVSQVSFSIDRLSAIDFTSVSPVCAPIGNFDFSLTGSKQIGNSIFKYDEDLVTNSGGSLGLGSMEWDTYNFTPTDSGYDLAGVSALNPISLLPNSIQNVGLILVPKDSNSLMVTVLDSVTKLPVTGATVELTPSVSGSSLTKITGEGHMTQTDWSGGDGQSIFSVANEYYSADGGVDVATSSGNVYLKQVFGQYDSNGILESSTFDTGSPSNFSSFLWNPTSQPTSAGIQSIMFQIATNATVTPTTTWDYLGPDGTASSYYTTPGSSIADLNNGKEYLRYKLFLSTEIATVTPVLSDVSFTYTSSCTPPGQVLFQGLSVGNYRLVVSKSGYSSSETDVVVSNGWQQQSVVIGP